MSAILPKLKQRRAETHKGDYGRVLVIGGSRGMSGAAAMTGSATLRSGAGLVTIATADSCLDTVASFNPCYTTMALPCDEGGCISVTPESEAARQLNERIAVADCVTLGPGIGRSEALVDFVVELYSNVDKPMVVDADGLNALASRPGAFSKHAGPRILTPHVGEFCRMTGMEEMPRAKTRELAKEFALENDVVLVLKGHRSLVTNGKQHSENSTGNPGMATGGMGDVLSGVLAALVVQGMTPINAAKTGTYIHGSAGDIAASQTGGVSLIATDVIDSLPAAFIAMGESS